MLSRPATVRRSSADRRGHVCAGAPQAGNGFSAAVCFTSSGYYKHRCVHERTSQSKRSLTKRVYGQQKCQNCWHAAHGPQRVCRPGAWLLHRAGIASQGANGGKGVLAEAAPHSALRTGTGRPVSASYVVCFPAAAASSRYTYTGWRRPPPAQALPAAAPRQQQAPHRAASQHRCQGMQQNILIEVRV